MNSFWKFLIALNGAVGLVGLEIGNYFTAFLNLTIFFFNLDVLIND